MLKQRYRRELKAAFAAAFATLDARSRNVLRSHYLEGLNIDEIGVLNGVHRTTAARWRADARQSLLKATRRQLQESLGANVTEVDSILRMIRSQLDVSLSRLLRGSDDA
jgi:RNA polymerase sigma-70 factor (ECF subfamily)